MRPVIVAAMTKLGKASLPIGGVALRGGWGTGRDDVGGGYCIIIMAPVGSR